MDFQLVSALWSKSVTQPPPKSSSVAISLATILSTRILSPPCFLTSSQPTYTSHSSSIALCRICYREHLFNTTTTPASISRLAHRHSFVGTTTLRQSSLITTSATAILIILGRLSLESPQPSLTILVTTRHTSTLFSNNTLCRKPTRATSITL